MGNLNVIIDEYIQTKFNNTKIMMKIKCKNILENIHPHIVILDIGDMEFFYIYLFLFSNEDLKDVKSLNYVHKDFIAAKKILYKDSPLSIQIRKFQILQTSAFLYDFNHDGIDELLEISEGGSGIHFEILRITSNLRTKIFSCSQDFPTPTFTPIEFLVYKKRQGIKFFDGEQWSFYVYDRVQQKYVMDASTSSENIEKIHGSPDFFAEDGIDYLKLERPLLESDLEGFSKAALRIWRNAIYARHGRIFKSEDLQALFNEYAWYKQDVEYSDESLSEIDKVNIKLIKEFEKK